jgi:hypothetical protein
MQVRLVVMAQLNLKLRLHIRELHLRVASQFQDKEFNRGQSPLLVGTQFQLQVQEVVEIQQERVRFFMVNSR